MQILRTIIPVTLWPSKAPCIAYDNVFARVGDLPNGVFVADADDGVHVKENLLDGKEFTYWSPGSSGVHYLYFYSLVKTEVNYIALHGHSMSTLGNVYIQVMYKTAPGAWTEVADKYVTDAGPIMLSFLPVRAKEWKIQITSPSNYRIAIAYIGRSMVMERGCWSGFTPPWMGRVAESITNVSESGSLLGRSFRRKGIKFSMDFTNISQVFIRDEWMPFVQSAESLPFFVQWNSLDYPLDVAFCWVNDASKDFKHPRYSSHSHMSCGVDCTGRVE